MTEKNDTNQNPADLSGDYALNALDASDAAAYEEYLAGSDEARTEAVELGDTALALGLAAVPVQPSDGLKASLMAKLASTPQLPPLPTPEAALVAREASTEVAGAGAAQPDAAAAEPLRDRSAAADRAERRWFRRPAGILI